MKILVINLGWEQHELISRVARRGHRLYGIHPTAAMPGHPGFEDVTIADLRDLPSILAYAEAVRPDAVISDQCDYSLFAWAFLAQRFGLPGPSLAAAQTSTNKILMRHAAADAGIEQPNFVPCSTLEEAHAAAEKLGYPVIIKPADNRGSFGVNRVASPNQLAPAVLDAVANSNGRQFVVECFVEGEQILVEGFFDQSGRHHSVALGRKTMRRIGTRQIADDITFSQDLSAPDDQAILAHNDAVAEGLGYQFGLTSGEYRIVNGRPPVLLEIANRGAGVSIGSIIAPAVSGIDTSEHLVRTALGEPADINLSRISGPTQSAYMHYLLYPPGRFSQVRGIEDARAVHGVKALQWYGKTRDSEIKPPRNDAERQGMIISLGDTVEHARQSAQDAVARIEVDYQ